MAASAGTVFRGGKLRDDTRDGKTAGAACCSRGVDSAGNGPAERGVARGCAERHELPEHRSISHVRVGHRDCRAGGSPADHLYTIYAATRTGGLWKTSNNGVTWDPISDSVEIAAVGAVALAPSNPSVVWMGTGDQANARSPTRARASTSPPTPARAGNPWG